MSGLSIAQTVADWDADEQARWLDSLDEQMLAEVARGEWWFLARPDQLEPDGDDWLIWLILAGRGFGKTRTGAEWLVDRMIESPKDIHGFATEWAAIGETLTDGRDILVEGPSGLVNVLRRRNIGYNYVRWPQPRITLHDGQKVHVLGAADGDVARGLNLAGVWMDEIAKWTYPTASWTEGIGPALRAKTPGGFKPRACVTTTPKPIRLLVDWTQRRDGSVHLTRGATFDNADNLSPEAIAEFIRMYGNSRIGRQELYADLLTDVEGALWAARWLEDGRKRPDEVPDLDYVVVAMDPAVSATESSDECGLVCVGRGVDGDEYVLADRSGKFVGREAARRAWQLWLDKEANIIVYEDNQGMEWIADVLKDVWLEMQAEGVLPYGEPPIRPVRAKIAKRLRAEPVALRYEQGRVHHVGVFTELEEQQTEWLPDSGESPDRLDALVHGLTALRRTEGDGGQVMSPAGTGRADVLASLPSDAATQALQLGANPTTQVFGPRIQR